MLKLHFTIRKHIRQWWFDECIVFKVGGELIPVKTTLVFNINGDFVRRARAVL